MFGLWPPLGGRLTLEWPIAMQDRPPPHHTNHLNKALLLDHLSYDGLLANFTNICDAQPCHTTIQELPQKSY